MLTIIFPFLQFYWIYYSRFAGFKYHYDPLKVHGSVFLCKNPALLCFLIVLELNLLCSGHFWALSFWQWCVATSQWKCEVGCENMAKPGLSVSPLLCLCHKLYVCVCLTEGGLRYTHTHTHTHTHARKLRAERWVCGFICALDRNWREREKKKFYFSNSLLCSPSIHSLSCSLDCWCSLRLVQPGGRGQC